MIEFRVSAPGKVILFGEHSVVYGKTAVTSSLDLRTTLTFRELPQPENESIHLLLPQVNLDKLVPTEKVQNFFFRSSPKPVSGSENFRKHVEEFVDSIGFENDPQKFSQVTLFYLLASIFQSENLTKVSGFQIRVRSELSISSGLGSSASFAVCVAACFSQYCRLLKNEVPELDGPRLETISKNAFECEKIMHGTPSGIDNTICTFGSIIEFRKNEGANLIPCTRNLRIMLVDTRKQRSTKALVERVARQKNQHPEIFEPLLQAMDHVARKAVEVVRRIQESDDDEACEQFSGLMEVNQGLLYACGVSHETLDTICIEARKFGFSAKLTGAGGGGYAYVFIPRNVPDERVQKLSRILTSAGFVTTLTTLGSRGVQIHQ